MQHFGEAKNQTGTLLEVRLFNYLSNYFFRVAILLHPRLTDPQNFDKTIMTCFRFEGFCFLLLCFFNQSFYLLQHKQYENNCIVSYCRRG